MRPKRPSDPRIEFHVVVNAMDGELLFRDAEDRENFKTEFARVLAISDVTSFAVSLMSTHFHWNMENGAEWNASRFTERVFGNYCRLYNKRHGRRGHVLRERFASFVIVEIRYSANVFRYVILNPWKARMVPSLSSLEHYLETSLPELLGFAPPRLTSVERTLARFDSDPEKAREMIRGWIRAGSRSDEWEREIHRAFRSKPSLQSLVPHFDVDGGFAAIVAEICAREHVPVESIRARGSASVTAVRREIAKRSSEELAMSQREIAARMNVAPSTISRFLAAERTETAFEPGSYADVLLYDANGDVLATGRDATAAEPPAQAK